MSPVPSESAESNTAAKPTLMLLRRLRTDLPPFLMAHSTERVKCLAQSFTVVVDSAGGDLGELCDRHEPDVIMLELGADSTWPEITNLSAHSDIPRIGFLNADPFDLARGPFVSAADKLGVGAYFTHSVSMGEYSPEFADRLFFWPNFVEPEVFHPYQLAKSTTILFSGSHAPLYPWRNRTRQLLEARYESTAMEHFGWSGSGANGMPIGADYARILASASFVPACGAIGREVVRKHLEIPAVGTCLIAERSESLRSFGFVDMQNCILGDGPELFEKIDFLVSHPDEYTQVTTAGAQLVSGHHTIENRLQVHQWFTLDRAGWTLEDICQDGPAGDLFARGTRLAARDRVVVSGGVDRKLLALGWSRFQDGDLASAAANFQRCLELTYIAEAVIGVVYCHLASGRAAAAETRLQFLWDMMAKKYGELTPDPVVIATMIRLRLCQSDAAGALALARRYASTRHPELDRIRAVLVPAVGTASESSSLSPVVPSICAPPQLEDASWHELLTTMLEACGQVSIAQALRGGQSLGTESASRPHESMRALQRGIDRGRRTTMHYSTDVARRVMRPLKRRWLGSPWGKRLAVAVHRQSPEMVVVVGQRRTSRSQLVLGWILRSTDAGVVVVSADDAASGGLPPGAEMLYLGRTERALLRTPGVLGRSIRMVVVERARVPRERLAYEEPLREMGFEAVDPEEGASGVIAVFVR